MEALEWLPVSRCWFLFDLTIQLCEVVTDIYNMLFVIKVHVVPYLSEVFCGYVPTYKSQVKIQLEISGYIRKLDSLTMPYNPIKKLE